MAPNPNPNLIPIPIPHLTQPTPTNPPVSPREELNMSLGPKTVTTSIPTIHSFSPSALCTKTPEDGNICDEATAHEVGKYDSKYAVIAAAFTVVIAAAMYLVFWILSRKRRSMVKARKQKMKRREKDLPEHV
ncbi:hypothetical protein P280DRAFT_549964 [Massarina eburnea CBS 473.64]|uniref:Uncharacterized protein n=1 Tax=Massarina eburnea CBS 473.64 TaxID=1395130 RepID=A0A6A6RXT2_9PLEO|nr:hypothetical protein P280DRAFT_549964 [Massarina eburnea CBS 473.64]